MKMKKVLSVIIALAMCVSLITAMPMNVSAATNVSYTFDDGDTTGWSGGTITDDALKLEGTGEYVRCGFGQKTCFESSFDVNFANVAGASNTDGTCFLNIGWTTSSGIDAACRGGYRFLYDNGAFDVQEHDTWATHDLNLPLDAWYTVKTVVDEPNNAMTISLYNKGETTALTSYSKWVDGTFELLDMRVRVSDGSYILLDNFVLEEGITTVTGGEAYVTFPADTVVTEGKWTGSFDFMTDVADGSSVAWRNTFMMGANDGTGTKVIGAWVYTEGTSGLHVKAGDWDGSYQCALTKGTWYTCKVVIDYDDTTSGTNARWYIYERDTDTLKAEYWWNATTSIDRLLVQDERGSGKCYVDNVEVSVEAPEEPEDLGPYQDQEYKFDDETLPTGWSAGAGDGYSITDGQLVLAGSPNWGVDVTFDPNLRESGKYIIGWDYTTQSTSFGDYGLFLKLLDSADMSQVKEVFSHMGDGQIHLGNNVFWNITTPTSRIELEVDVDTKAWQLYVDGNAVTSAGGSGVGTWTESLAIGFMNYQHGTCKIDNVTVTKVVEEEPEIPTGITTVTGGETYINFPQETVVTEGKWTGSFDFMTDVADDANIAWRNTFMMGANDGTGTKVIGAWVYNEGANVHVKAGDWDGSYQCGLAKNTWYTCKVVIDYGDITSGSNARWYIYERDTDTLKAEYWANITSSIDRLLVQDERNSGKCYVENVTVAVEESDTPTIINVTNAETYIEFPADTVVTEGKWTGSFDFMTDVEDGSNVAWRNTFMMGANDGTGTKVIGAWVYTEGTSGLHIKAGDWDGSYQCALTKGTWYTCKVVIDYEDTTSGNNARWYIYEKDTDTLKAEYWWNATTSIDRLLVQDEQNSGKCYVDNVTVTVSEHEHAYGEWETDGTENHKKTCVCGDVVTETHAWDEGVVTLEPTVEAEGVKTYTCSVCGGTKTEAIDKLPAPSYRLGDANSDSEVDVKDVIMIRRFITGGYGVTFENGAADVNEDGEVEVKDAIIIRRFIAGGYGIEL